MKPLSAIIVSLLFIAVLGVVGEQDYQDELRAYTSSHKCKLIGKAKAGAVTTMPEKSGYQCDDGVTYWR